VCREFVENVSCISLKNLALGDTWRLLFVIVTLWFSFSKDAVYGHFQDKLKEV
jgi:hypothetical protein